jgi:UDP-N-acetylmuramoyl-tripeptide--D-alanyl-D-alanine ligase
VTVDRPSPRPRDAAVGARERDGSPFLTTDDLQALTGGRLLATSRRPIRGAAVDSRAVQPGELFAALPGERTDGHRFLAAAAAAGASALIVSEAPKPVDLAALGDVTVILVPDVLRALQSIAAGWRARFNPLVVGITGSIAKTSTKEAVATVLAADRRTLKSEGNQNNEIGLPLTVLRLGPEDEAAVLEMGMYVGGEIRDLAAIARPHIGVVTAVLGVHLSRIGTIEAVEQAKGELVEALPANGVAILNADDPRVLRMRDRTQARVLTYGFGADADIGALAIESAGLDGMRFALRLPGVPDGLPAIVPGLGRLSVHNALAGAAVGLAAGMSPSAIVAALAEGWSAPHRGQVTQAGGITIIDDAYNASPASVTAALELLAGIAGRHVAVLGEMRELGDGTEAGHLEAGRAAARVCDLLCVVGTEADGIAQGAREAGLSPERLVEVADQDEAQARLLTLLRPGDVVLVKASRGVALETLVDGLAAALADGSPR